MLEIFRDQSTYDNNIINDILEKSDQDGSWITFCRRTNGFFYSQETLVEGGGGLKLKFYCIGNKCENNNKYR